MEGDKLQQIIKEFNRILEEEVAPYRILNGLVVPIIGESELTAIAVSYTHLDVYKRQISHSMF